MGTMTKFHQDEETGNYFLSMRTMDDEHRPVDDVVTTVEWTPEEFDAVCMVSYVSNGASVPGASRRARLCGCNVRWCRSGRCRRTSHPSCLCKTLDRKLPSASSRSRLCV